MSGQDGSAETRNTPPGEERPTEGGDNPGGAPPDSAGDASPSDPEMACSRAKQFLLKQKEDNIRKIKAGLGDEYLAYDAIVAARKKSFATPHLLSGETADMPELGSFLSNGDGRNLLAHMEVNLGQRRVTSYSFHPTILMCRCPGPHNTRLIAAGLGGPKTQREAIILADQSYPHCAAF
jgi:hypothetical protein